MAKTTQEWIEQVQQLMGTIRQLVADRTELSLGSVYKEGIILKVFNPVIPSGAEVQIIDHVEVDKIGAIGTWSKARRTVTTIPEGNLIVVSSVNDIEATDPAYQRRANVFYDNRVANCKFSPKKVTPVAGTIGLVNEHTGLIEAVLKNEEPTSNAMVTIVRRVIDENRVEIDANRTAFYFNMELEEEDEVLVDQSGTIVLRRIKANRLAGVSTKASEASRTEWKDVVGLEEAKMRVVENIIQPIQNKDIYAAYGMNKLPKGMILAGPAGCGKTMLGRAVATAIADASGSTMSESGFVYVKSTELLDSYVGESEKRVRAIFASAANHYEDKGFPAVVFIDEADAILATRGSHAVHSAHSLVAPFLTEMDGFDHQRSFVILATNRLDILDPAITRNGRIDFKVKVTRPTKDTAKQILASYLSKTFAYDSIAEMSDAAIDLFWSDNAVISTRVTTHNNVKCIRARDIVNGAMLKSIVDEAVTNAIRRDMSSASRTRKASGVVIDDVLTAINSVIAQNAILAHEEVWDEVYGN